MSLEKKRVLVVDDNEGVCRALSLMLGDAGMDVNVVNTPERLPEIMRELSPGCVLLDMNFKAGIITGNEGLYWLKWLRGNYRDTPVVLMTAFGDIDLAVKGIKDGATDFIVKPVERDRIMAVLDGLPKWRKKATGVKKISRSFFYGESHAMSVLKDMIDRVAPTMASVLITGANGTGKSALVKEIHEKSARRGGSLVHVDMGAVADTLFESELFGYAKGAFTGAVAGKAGLIEEADGGTLFLDEIANLPLRLQAKLLCVLQERRLTRLGETKPRDVDIRLVSATSADLEKLVMEGTFRQDLLFRINTIHLDIPPLNRRGKDIVELARMFIDRYSAEYRDGMRLDMSSESLDLVLSYSWPGNVRELEHVMEKAVIMTDGDVIEPEAMGIELSARTEGVSLASGATMEDMERDVITRRIEEYESNMTLVAKSLGISRQTLYNKIKRYGL